MTEYAPAAIRAMFNTVRAKIPSARMGGILGDRAHTYGYHRGRAYVGGNDYSVTRADDKAGDSQAASALDISLPADQMKVVTARLIRAAKAKDPRLRPVREFYGTTTGKSVTGLDLPSLRWVSSDSSHLWHVHISILRRFANNQAALQGVAGVVIGTPPPKKPAAKPPVKAAAKPGGPRLRRSWPSYMKAGDYFGLITGPAHSRGGYTAQARPAVQAIQTRLVQLGYGKGVKYTPGRFEASTAKMVTAWQHKAMPGTKFYGQVWADDWKKLFTY